MHITWSSHVNESDCLVCRFTASSYESNWDMSIAPIRLVGVDRTIRLDYFRLFTTFAMLIILGSLRSHNFDHVRA